MDHDGEGRGVRPDQKSGEQESDNAGETNLLAQKAAYAGEEGDDRQVLNEIQLTHVPLPPFHKHRRRPWWDDELTDLALVSGLPDNWIGLGVPENRMEFQSNAAIITEIECLLNFIGVEKYHDAFSVGIECSQLGIMKDHDNQRLLLAGAAIVKSH